MITTSKKNISLSVVCYDFASYLVIIDSHEINNDHSLSDTYRCFFFVFRMFATPSGKTLLTVFSFFSFFLILKQTSLITTKVFKTWKKRRVEINVQSVEKKTLQ